MAANIDQILDCIEKMVPELDIQILNGDMIVSGDLQQISMMLELINEIILMTVEGEEELEEGAGEQAQLNAADQIIKEQLRKQQEAAQEAQYKIMQEQHLNKPQFGQQPSQSFHS